MVYEPREDSEFLAQFVAKHAKGDVLDMGTGSGIQARTAAACETVKTVLAVDVDAEAVKQLQDDPNINARESDLFANVEESFDTILCNPPYLPNEPKDEDVALYGGPNGYEFVARFLKEAKDHLKESGSILLLFSSLTNHERVLQLIDQEGYHAEELGQLAMFFERLYVYKLTR